MNGLLDYARAKLGRAHHHLNELHAQVADYLASEPYSVTVDVDLEARKQFHRIHIRPIPVVEWALLIGDCVHNARSALDHAVWSLAFRYNPAGTPKDRTTAFPIFSSRKSWKDYGGLRAIRRLPPHLQTFIKWTQPYRRRDPKYHPLTILHELDNEDKHKVLTITVLATNQTTMRVHIGGPDYSDDRSDVVYLGAFEDGAIIAEGPSADVKMDVRPVLNVGFRDIADPKSGLPMPVVGALRWMLSCVGSILEDLDRFSRRHP